MMIQKKILTGVGSLYEKASVHIFQLRKYLRPQNMPPQYFFFLQLPETEAAQSGKYLPLHHPHSQLQAAATRNKAVP